MNVVALRAPSAQTLLRLGRVSNLPTVWTNVIAGATIANTAANIVDVALDWPRHDGVLRGRHVPQRFLRQGYRREGATGPPDPCR